MRLPPLTGFWDKLKWLLLQTDWQFQDKYPQQLIHFPSMMPKKQEKCSPLTADPCLVDFLKCYVGSAQGTVATNRFSWKGVLLFSFTKLLYREKSLQILPCSVFPFSAQSEKEQAISRRHSLPSPLPVIFCHLFWGSPGGAGVQDQSNCALTWVRASIPPIQAITWNGWWNDMNTNGYTPPTFLKHCQNQNLQKESFFPTLQLPPIDTRVLLGKFTS